jgi:hypothetical protein
MSATLAITKPDCIHVLADASFYDKVGTLTAFHPKVLKMPRANAVFASRGRAMAFPLFLKVCEEFDYSSFDEFVSSCTAENVFKVMDGVFAEVAPGEGYEIIVAGWSDKRDHGEVLYHSTLDLHEGLPAGAIHLLGNVVGFGVVADCSAAEFDPRVHGLKAFDEARRTLCDLSCGLGEPVIGHSVGGYLNHAVVTAAGVEWDVLKFWPDEISEKIKPDGEILAEGWWDRERMAA